MCLVDNFPLRPNNNIFKTLFYRINNSKVSSIKTWNMKFLGACMLVCLLAGAKGQTGYHGNPDTNTCDNTVTSQCGRSGSSWNGGFACSSLYGGFKGNQHNLNVMMKNHLRDSFKFLLMVSLEIIIYRLKWLFF